jgi:hypothetical protein
VVIIPGKINNESSLPKRILPEPNTIEQAIPHLDTRLKISPDPNSGHVEIESFRTIRLLICGQSDDPCLGEFDFPSQFHDDPGVVWV